MIKKAATFIAGFVVGIVVLQVWGYVFNKDLEVDSVTAQDATERVAGTDPITGNAQESEAELGLSQEIDAAAVVSDAVITVVPQPAGDTVTVASVTLRAGSTGGWVVVHEVVEGVIVNALGAVRKDSGVHTDVLVKLLRSTTPHGTYAVVLYGDNGDRQFSLKTDKPLTNSNGTYVMSMFNAQ